MQWNFSTWQDSIDRERAPRCRRRGTGPILATLAPLLLLASLPVSGDEFRHHPMRFEHVSLDQGLSQSNVLAILQDESGLMWFGTENGLNSYNGYDFEHFTRQRGNPDALGNDFIFDLAEDGGGNLWIATNGGGLAMLDRRTGRFTTYRHDPADAASLGSNIVRRVLIDDDGAVWAGTRGAGLSRLDRATGKFTHVRFDGPDNIFALLRDSTGTLWAGGDHGLSRLDAKTGAWQTYAHDAADSNSLSDHSVRTVFEDGNGRLWVGTYGGGLHLLDGETGSFERFVHDANDPASISGNRVAVVFEDSERRLWVGTTTGLNLLDRDTGRFVRYLNAASDVTSLADNSVTTIYEDRSGVLWVGTQTSGISKWNPRTWAYGFEPATALATADSRPNVTSFVEDANGRLWIGTFGDGLNAVDRATGEVVRYRHAPANPAGLADDRVMSLLRDRDGRIWIGTMTRGIFRLDPETGRMDLLAHDPDDPASLSANGIMALYEDSAGRVWVGTYGGGISRFDPQTRIFTRFRADPDDPAALSSDRVTSFAEGPDGRMWVGTDSGGLNLFDPGTRRFHRFRHDPDSPTSLADDTVYSLNVDASGTVWVGTRGGGLDRVVGDPGAPASIRFANLSTADGLANNVVYGIHSDRAGQLWMSTNYGISRFDPATGEFRNLHRNDGLQSEEFNFGAHYESESGELFFGGHNGYNAFRPEAIRTNANVPPVVLTGFFNRNEPVRSGLPLENLDSVELGYRDDTVSFEFAALDYAAPAQNRYMYKLEGFDSDWTDLGNQRRVTYTDLDPGAYVLRVRAANSDGVWNESGYSIPVTVAAPPWASWWAYLGYVAMLVQGALFLWFAHKRRIRREEEYSARLEQEVSARTEQLIDSNKRLHLLNQALQESSLSDPLTGLRNRRFVFEEVSRDIDVVRRRICAEQEGIDQGDTIDLVFMMIDLDNFKPINDTYGHAAGDQMLIEVRDVLLGTCRRSDFVIRWGGDEFLVIAKQARPGEAEALAERIRNTISGRNFTLGDGQMVKTTCSIGFAAYPLFRASLDESSLDQIISLADNLMYEAKKRRNAWAGMFGPSEASTSFGVEDGSLEPTSLLFRAKRSGKLMTHDREHDDEPVRRVASRHN